jgi:hypothetical protein
MPNTGWILVPATAGTVAAVAGIGLLGLAILGLAGYGAYELCRRTVCGPQSQK